MVLIWFLIGLVVFVVLLDESGRAGVLQFLNDPYEGSWYSSIVTPVSKWPRDWRCFDWALRLAVVYPILSMVLIWAIWGHAGTIGTVEFLPAHDSWAVRVAIVCGIATAVLATIAKRWAAASIHPMFRRYSDQMQTYLLLVAFWVSFTFVGTGAAVATGALAAAIAGEGAFAFVFSAAFSVAFAVAALLPVSVEELSSALGSMLVAYPLAFIVGHLTLKAAEHGKGRRAYAVFFCLIVLALTLALRFLPWVDIPDRAHSIFLFIGILPLVNALTDYLSYVVTFKLVDWGRKTKGWAFAMGLLDVFVAGLIFVPLLGALLVAVVAGANALAGVALFPLAPLFYDLRAHPGQYWWLYAMLFSTLVPTLAHLVVAGFSAVALPFYLLIRLPWEGWITKPGYVTTFGPPVFLGLAGTLSVLAPFGFGYGLYLGASAVLGDVLQLYIGYIERMAAHLGEG